MRRVQLYLTRSLPIHLRHTQVAERNGLKFISKWTTREPSIVRSLCRTSITREVTLSQRNSFIVCGRDVKVTKQTIREPYDRATIPVVDRDILFRELSFCAFGAREALFFFFLFTTQTSLFPV